MARIFAPLLDPDHGIYLEEYFSELICMERKRTERSLSFHANQFTEVFLQINSVN